MDLRRFGLDSNFLFFIGIGIPSLIELKIGFFFLVPVSSYKARLTFAYGPVLSYPIQSGRILEI
jgi:hypothetical protein